MQLIQTIGNEPKQRMAVILPDGSQMSLQLEYKPMQFGWFITELVYGSFVLNGVRICTSPNFLNQFRNQIPFGLCCYTRDGGEPMIEEDFASARCLLYLLSSSETKTYSEILSGQVGT